MSALLGFFLVLFLLVVAFFLSKRYEKSHPDKAEAPTKASVTNKPNTTNYNIDMLDDQDIEGATPEEAREILRKMESGDISLSEHDFFLLKKKIEQS